MMEFIARRITMCAMNGTYEDNTEHTSSDQIWFDISGKLTNVN
jgi:hypothetical protein